MVVHGYLTGYLHQASETGPPKLTPREIEIIQLLAEGRSNKEVAYALDIQVKTVESHRSNITHKLGLRSIADLEYAIRNKIVGP